MNKQQFKQKADQKIEELSKMIDKLKIQALEDITMKHEFDNIIKQLEKIRDSVKYKYEKIENESDRSWDEFQKNIYQDLETFDNAFKKAGSLFKPMEKKTN